MTATAIASPLKVVYCTKCNYSTPYQQSLKNHMYKHHGLNVEEAKPFVCKLCPYRTNYKGNLRKHLRTHTGERPYQCRVCQKGFTTTSNLKTHEIHRHGLHKTKRTFPLHSSLSTSSLTGMPTNLTLTNSLSAQVSVATHSETMVSMDVNHKSRPQDLQKSPASSSIVSFSSDDVTESPEEQKPIFRWMDTSSGGIELTKEVPMNIITPTLISPPIMGSVQNKSPAHTIKIENDHEDSDNLERKLGFDFRRSTQNNENDENVPWNLVSPNFRESNNQETSTNGKRSAGENERHDLFHYQNVDTDNDQSVTNTSQYGERTRDTDELTQALLDQLVKEGRLQRCDHCNIIFPELSMYIFHRGCHGHQHPFQCHFCSAILKDKFEFAAHFMYCVHHKH